MKHLLSLLSSAGHFGLDGIIERVERLGGTFEIESSPGKGTYAVMSFSKTP